MSACFASVSWPVLVSFVLAREILFSFSNKEADKRKVGFGQNARNESQQEESIYSKYL